MKKTDRNSITRLEELPNIGKAIAEHLRIVDIHHPEDLKGKEALELYTELCSITGKRHDPCLLDVFMATVAFMEGGEQLPWWSFTAERKKFLLKHPLNFDNIHGKSTSVPSSGKPRQ